MRTYKTTYTKHYYIEGERICSKIGGGFQWAHTPPTSNPIDFIEGNPHTCSMHLREMVDRNTQCAEYDGEMDIRPELAPAHNNGNEYENLQYFYHPDHLGSASFVTDREGAVCQHIQYLPFGELFVSQRNSEFDSRYKFTAKELDNETSYTYFGARYYDADLSNWLSVDPLSDKYPSLSPYCYSADNPVVLVDPNGASINPIYDTDGNFLGTDDKGLQGDAIVMKKSDFKQGMSHEEALSKSTDLNTNNREGAEMKMNIHYSGLKDRPDWDGKLTLSEANEWYRNGNGEPLFVDLSKIDLSGIYSLGEKYVGQVKTFNLLLNSGSLNDGLVYGKIHLSAIPIIK